MQETVSPYYLLYDHLRVSTVPKEYKFETWFPDLVPTVVKYFETEIEELDKYPFNGRRPISKKFQGLTDEITKLIPYWSKLAGYTEGRICYHIYSVFFCLLHDPGYLSLSKYDKNVLLWTNLFHDISKRGTPEVEGKDNIHPFKSAWRTLHVMQDSLNWINIKEEEWKVWDDIFDRAYMFRNGEIVQDHSYLKSIKAFLDKNVGDNKFLLDIIYMTLLHQSLPNMKEWKHKSIIHPLEEVKYYFDSRRMKLMKIFMRNDSVSYTLFKPMHTTHSCSHQLDRYIDVLIKYLECIEEFDAFALEFGEAGLEETSKKYLKTANGTILRQTLIDGVIVQYVAGEILNEKTDAIREKPQSKFSKMS